MFNNLIESGSHRRELARKSRFFLGTLGLYAALLTASGVASVVAYDARLERQNLELTTMVAPVPYVAPPVEPTETIKQSPPAAGDRDRVATRTELYADLKTTATTPPPVSTSRSNVPPVPPGMRAVLGETNFTPEGGVGPRVGAGPGTAGVAAAGGSVRVADTVDPRPPEVRPTPAPAAAPRPDRIRVTSSVLTGKVLSKPVPPYPAIAKAARVSGPVNVEIVIDEQGRVVSANAVSGPALLRAAAEQAARRANFMPTLLGGQPVKVSGMITYNFVLN